MNSNKSISAMTFIVASLVATAGLAENGGRGLEDPEINVIGITPLPANGIDLNKYPGNAQSISSEEADRLRSLQVSDSLYQLSSSFNINSTQNNPYQNDVYYRGFLVSPLVGTANGLSVYLDGVRLNEGFGDTLNWDLIPESAISTIDVIPGSNPLFGRNTLGGALSLRTKSGFTHPGTRLEGSYGSFDRYSIDLEHGGSYQDFDWYVNAHTTEEDGWRERSPSEVRQLFTKFGWETSNTDIDVSFLRADNDLIGNGLAPEGLLALHRDAIHSYPDQTKNEVTQFNVNMLHETDYGINVAGNFFRRSFTRNTLNGDAEIECEVEAGDEEYGVGFASGRPFHPQLCNEDEINRVLRNPPQDFAFTLTEGGDDDDNGGESTTIRSLSDLAQFETDNNDREEVEFERGVEGEERMTFTETRTTGGGLELSFDGDFANFGNKLTVGFSYVRNETEFRQSEAKGRLNQGELRRGRTGVGIVDVEEQKIEVDIATEEDSYGIYVTDSLDLADNLTVTGSLRYQRSNLEIINRSGNEDDDDLNGDHTFDRINPAGGIALRIFPELNFFASYSEGFRVPTAAELTCADPDDPCNLPNAFVADPHLDPVVARTYEFGFRGDVDLFFDDWQYNLAFFRTDLSDDLFFVHSTTTGGGFFRNIGDTRRQGLEFSTKARYQNLNMYFNYGYLEATIEDDITLSNITSFEGIQVQDGDSLPGIPKHSLRVGGSYQVLPFWSFGADVRYASSVYLRGDESNDQDKIAGYTVLNLNTEFNILDHAYLWVEVENVFDTDYETAGARAWNALPQAQGKSEIGVENFLAPGAPRAFWVGLSIRI